MFLGCFEAFLRFFSPPLRQKMPSKRPLLALQGPQKGSKRVILGQKIDFSGIDLGSGLGAFYEPFLKASREIAVGCHMGGVVAAIIFVKLLCLCESQKEKPVIACQTVKLVIPLTASLSV